MESRDAKVNLKGKNSLTSSMRNTLACENMNSMPVTDLKSVKAYLLSKSDIRMIFILFIITLINFVSFLPAIIFDKSYFMKSVLFYYIYCCVCLISSPATPILYYLMNMKFQVDVKKKFISLLRCFCN